ncbi:hypothetical protein MTR_6g053030 [Medicago truncatula]|uniref:Transposase (putative) gypsy type domain-containing protein n=1 Tax=Medicago truncatula TaxID=3880 RepID=A0A072UKN1_MEDTR|nr:hypothetical protein MTR_6g053030 [Medicago truncatula]
MVVVRECDERGRELPPSNPLDRQKLRLQCLKHATRGSGLIDWKVYDYTYFSHMTFSDISSESDCSEYDDSDCVLLYSTSGDPLGQEDVATSPSKMVRGKGTQLACPKSDTKCFSDDVQRYESAYKDQSKVNFFRSKILDSSTMREEDIILTPCPPGEKVCTMRPKGVKEIFHMYGAVLEEFGVKIPFTLFEMDVLRLLNVAPSQIHPNSWAFICGFEILCEALDMIPSAGFFFLHFYGTKGVDKGSWVPISAHPGKQLFPAFASNFKRDWKKSFFRVEASKNSSVSVASVVGEVKFPLGWTANPVAVSGYEYKKMSPYEQGVVGFLDRMLHTDLRKLLNKEGDSKDLELYLLPMLPLSRKERRKYLEALKEKHASGEHIASDPAGIILRKGAKKRENVSSSEPAGGDVDVVPEKVAEVEVTGGEVNDLTLSTAKKKMKVGRKGGGRTLSIEAAVDKDTAFHGKFDELVQDAGTSTLRTLLYIQSMERKHEALEKEYQDSVKDVEKFKHKATAFEERVEGLLKDKSVLEKTVSDMEKEKSVWEGEKKALEAQNAKLQGDLDKSKDEVEMGKWPWLAFLRMGSTGRSLKRCIFIQT